ncbi:hypothetical protein F2Q70_00017874 [Brassica cretica]|uniref:Uncharacterized protein n=1 Tax=Brassica cretica TaxID=69181 RepID=A0A8S9HRH7_BRACR|nr:hypothetical protein F2Q70_00017874 [Brassica cretica]
MNLDTPAFPSSFVGGRTRPRLLSADPFSSPTSVWGEISKVDNEAVPMAPLRQCFSYFLEDGPRSEIQEESLINIRKKFAIPPSVVMRCPSEFERAPDGGSDEIAIYEAYLEAGFGVGVPSIVAEVSSFFSLCPSQLTPLTWRTLMAIQVLGKPGFYHLRSRDGTPLVEDPSRGIKGNYPFGDDWDKRYLFVKIPGSSPYPSFWRIMDVAHPVSFIGEVVAKVVLGVPQRFRWVNFLMSKEALRYSRNVARLSVSIIYDEYQKAKTQKRRPFYTPPPRLVRAASSVSGPSFVPPAGTEAPPARISPMVVHQRLLTELFFLRNQVRVRGMAFHRDQSVLRARATARWELMKEWLEKKVDHWNPEEEYRRYLLWAEGVDQLMTGGPIPTATSGSAAGSRYSGDPFFECFRDAFFLFMLGPYSTSLGETTTGTCWDFTFYRSEAGHYRVPVLHAASTEATIRLIKVLLVWMKIQGPDFTALHVWSSSRVLPNLVPLLGDPRLSLLIMAPGRVPSVGDQSVLRARATARWELMKEWLEKKVGHWNPEEEYRRYLLWAEGVDQLMTGGPVPAATSGSAAGSRYSGDPFF